MACDWRDIRRGYERAGLSFAELAEKYGAAAGAIERRAKKEGWRAAANGDGSAKNRALPRKRRGLAVDGDKAIINGIKKRLIKGLKTVDSKKGLEELKVAKAAGEVMEGLCRNERGVDGGKGCACSGNGQDAEDIAGEMESLTVPSGTGPALEGE